MSGFVIALWRRLFLRRRCYRLNRFLFGLSLRGLGLLNYDDSRMSGEDHLLRRITGEWNRRAAAPGPLVLDVGANQGLYSTRVKELCPTARVHGFEPHPRTFKELQRRADEHRFTAVHAACGETCGVLRLYDYASTSDSQTRETAGSEHASLYADVLRVAHQAQEVEGWDVNVTTVDQYVADNQLGTVQLLKVDTEGHELKVLLGAKEAIAQQRIEIIHFEFNEMNVVSRVFLRDFIELLKGYRLYRLVPDGLIPIGPYRAIQHELFGYQNIIALVDSRADALEEIFNG